MLVNYGIVEEGNPHDKLIITATIPNSDPLFKEKRAALQPAMAKLATQQPFDLTPKACPPVLPYTEIPVSILADPAASEPCIYSLAVIDTLVCCAANHTDPRSPAEKHS